MEWGGRTKYRGRVERHNMTRDRAERGGRENYHRIRNE